MLSAGVNELVGPAIADSRLFVGQRLVGFLVAAGRRDDAIAVQRILREGPAPRTVVDGVPVADLPFLDERGTTIPAGAFEIAAHER